jgi:hypothetical protein
MDQTRVFISYSRDDGGDFARHLKRYLDKKGYNAFLDTSSLSVGAKWRPRIEAAIDSSDIFILIITTKTIDSNEVKDEYSIATNKRKIPMLFKHEQVNIQDLGWGLKERNLLEFSTPESLIRTFEDKIREIDKLLTHGLTDPFAVESKIKSLKEDFESMSKEYSVETLKSYTDDNFIPILTFLKKSTVFYPPEVEAIEKILARVLKLSQNINENQENFEETFVKTDADLLKSSVSQFLDRLLEFFIKNTPEKRQQATKHEVYEKIQVKQIVTETKDFLNISVDRSITESDKHEFLKRDIENQKIDLRFFFLWPDSIKLWFKIINRSEYKLQQLGRDLIAKNANELIDVIFENSSPNNNRMDFIDLGVGAAVKDYYIIKAMLQKMPKDSQERMTYIPIDYSIGILQKTMDYMEELMDSYPNKLHIEGILGDFLHLVRYSDKIKSISQSPKVFALLGNIFGNVDEDRILEVITKAMGSDDLLLLEIDLINDRTDDQLKEGYGSDEITRNWLLSPIINYFKAEDKETRTRIEDFDLVTEVQEMGLSRVPKSKTVTTAAYYGLNKREKIELIYSHKYDLENLLNFMYERWKLGHLKTYKEQNACLLLLSKRRAEIKVPTGAVQEIQI